MTIIVQGPAGKLTGPYTRAHERASGPRRRHEHGPEGVVKWLTAFQGAVNLFSGAGVHFIDLSDLEQERLRNFVSAEGKDIGLDD